MKTPLVILTTLGLCFGGFAQGTAPLPTLALGGVTSSNMALSWPASYIGYTLQTKTDLTDSNWTDMPVAINSLPGTNQAVVSLPANSAFYRLVSRQSSLGASSGAVIAKGTISLTGGGSIDSFNSADPTYSSNGLYDASKRRANAVVLTDSSANPAISTGTGKIYGYAVTGPGGTVTGSVGDIAYNATSNSFPEAGHIAQNANVQFAEVAAPFPYGTGTTPVSGTNSYGGTNYTYQLGTGNYNMPNGSHVAGGQAMLITGNPTVLYINGSFSISGSGFIYIAPGASLLMYINGMGTFSGVGVNGAGNATNCYIYGMTNCTSLTYSAANQFVGVVYAPEAAFTQSGSGGFSGSLTANTVTIIGGSLHFDESLIPPHL